MKKLLSGNESIALGAYHAGLCVAAAYPGTPSTEILENLSRFKDIHAEWAPNEKVAFEVGLGACYTGVRALVLMKHVGLNVAADPFMAAAVTGVCGGLVLVSADDPGIHSSQNEQDNRNLAKFAKIALLEPSDSQEAYDIMPLAFDISERFDTPVMVRSTTRISHAKTIVDINRDRSADCTQALFRKDMAKFVTLPVNARHRQLITFERLDKLAEYSETCSLNRIIQGGSDIGVISSCVAFNYAREVLPQASFLKLGMSYPLPQNMIRRFAASVKRLVVIEELDPFIEEQIRAMGIEVEGKAFIPGTGELNRDIIRNAARKAGWGVFEEQVPAPDLQELVSALPKRPPLLCSGCPHIGVFSVLNSLGLRRRSAEPGRAGLIITGDIGCYTLAAYPPLSAMDTCACMGAGIGQALGMEKAGISDKLIAVIGDSTFLHSGITGLINAVYNKSQMTIAILDNRTTAMTGHQHHPGTGFTAQGEETYAVDIISLVKSCGVTNVHEVPAFDIRAIRTALKEAIDKPELVVLVIRGDCIAISRKKAAALAIDAQKCARCDICLGLGCSALQKAGDELVIDAQICSGCTLCQQICPGRAIEPVLSKEGGS
ncbi:MAG: indolepyruvate ferredoxin oxidoreductase subunit alpha [Dehalococcoidia bacterium]|nr:indolepyruvate ferredoxin oxidoreductase subunit alpha [Dehalococcoidia bacterium]